MPLDVPAGGGGPLGIDGQGSARNPGARRQLDEFSDAPPLRRGIPERADGSVLANQVDRAARQRRGGGKHLRKVALECSSAIRSLLTEFHLKSGALHSGEEHQRQVQRGAKRGYPAALALL